MSKTAASQSLLQLLVRLYNQSIQTYFHFPDVIICGHHRIDEAEFNLLVVEGFVDAFYVDSFGKLFRLSKKAHHMLQYGLHKRRPKSIHHFQRAIQAALPF
ncbi:MAG: hypothetical protein EOO10_18615 [Chitinophagaceae bacterium]|nr:MAG: hypothetical protein EOO10_18615 [Chitinophagaceae bacterium]